MRTVNKYSYILFPSCIVHTYFQTRGDGRGKNEEIEAALRAGYRWIRSESGFAVFEQERPVWAGEDA